MRSLIHLSARLGCPAPDEYTFSNATIDSREAGPSSLFFALQGRSADGHDFVADVLGAGGAAVVSRDGFIGAILEVDSVEEALMEAGAWARDGIKHPVIGITGSSGKTTTRKMLAAALSTRFRTWQTKGNLNNHLGLPLTLLNTPADVEMLVLEMGMNHTGELLRLGWAARPNLSLITNIGTAHIQNFGSRGRIAEAKAEILRCTEKGGIAIIPHGEEILLDEAELRGLEVITHGPGGDCFLDRCRAMPWGIDLALEYSGEHNMQNAVAVIAAAQRLGVDPVEAAEAISKLHPGAGRGDVFHTKDFTVIDESYNSNPESVTACLKSAVHLHEKPLVAVLGDMLELGDRSLSSHKEVLRKAKELGYDLLILVGFRFKEAAESDSNTNISFATDWKEALSILKRSVKSGSTILVKGSNSMKLGQLVVELKREGI
ncbi:MAG: UDP-N-acetylmuramoyl-tripeptide--D-alanyl-D-alanine ligase [Candidatus Sabulitectum sp.]|nr:UDP-N-acetylmuramoyl-tripeptide--D-alanyl-D-alanine ligase [Candidatus Sabulitectum sp.]